MNNQPRPKHVRLAEAAEEEATVLAPQDGLVTAQALLAIYHLLAERLPDPNKP